MTTERKTILVLGGTGSQGGSVVDYLLKDGNYNVRVLTRDLQSDKAKKLVDRGVEVWQGDLNDVESLVRAMDNTYGVFGVTNFWDPSVGYEKEIQHGKNIGEACKRANVKHLVFSTLDKNSDVPHFESKVLAEEHIRELGVPTTYLVTSFYFENFGIFFPPKEDQDGTMVFSVAQKPTTLVPMYSVADTGGWVTECFRHPEKYIGKDVPAVGEYVSYPQLVETFSKVTERPAKFNQVPLNDFKNAGFPGAEELAMNLKFFDDITDGNKKDRRCNLEDGLKTSQNVWSGGVNWEGWLRRTGWMSKSVESNN